MGKEPAPAWLAADELLAQFAKRRSVAQQRYAQFVAEGMQAESPWSNLKGQVFLGDEQFVERMQAHIEAGKDDVQIPRAQRRPRAPVPAQQQRVLVAPGQQVGAQGDLPQRVRRGGEARLDEIARREMDGEHDRPVGSLRSDVVRAGPGP